MSMERSTLIHSKLPLIHIKSPINSPAIVHPSSPKLAENLGPKLKDSPSMQPASISARIPDPITVKTRMSSYTNALTEAYIVPHGDTKTSPKSISSSSASSAPTSPDLSEKERKLLQRTLIH